MEFAISSFPVLVFLTVLFLMDSFRLIRRKWLIFSLMGGVIAALAAYGTNTLLASSFSCGFGSAISGNAFLTRHSQIVTENQM